MMGGIWDEVDWLTGEWKGMSGDKDWVLPRVEEVWREGLSWDSDIIPSCITCTLCMSDTCKGGII